MAYLVSYVKDLVNAVGLPVRFLPARVDAGGSWLDKGLNILKKSGEEGDEKVKLQRPAYSNNEIGRAFKEALQIGAVNVVKQLGAVDGFNGDPSIHIPLPKELSPVKVVSSEMGDNLELKLNRAAELAVPRAKNLFLQAIADITLMI